MSGRCSFGTTDHRCVGIVSSLDQLAVQNGLVLLSEIGLLPVPSQLTSKVPIYVCEVHLSQLLSTNANRSRSRNCCVPDGIARHKGSKAKATRRISTEKVLLIHKQRGVILPIGTPVCSTCRRIEDEDSKTANDDNKTHLILGGACDQRPASETGSPQLSHVDVAEVGVQQPVSGERAYHSSNGDYGKACVQRPVSGASTLHTQQGVICEKRVRRPKVEDSCWINIKDMEDNPSQESSTMNESQETNATNTSLAETERLDKLNDFLTISGFSPVKQLSSDLTISSHRTQRRYIAKARECVDALVDTVCPISTDFIKNALFAKDDKDNTDKSASDLLVYVANAYIQADSSSLRRQLLSILTTDYNHSEVQAAIPCVTRNKFYAAKKHKEVFGTGVPEPSSKTLRTKVDDGKLEHFLDFITSSHIIRDLPFGEKNLKLSTGEVIQTPNVIRCLAPATIIKQYTQMCAEEEIPCIGTSTMHKILSECSASARTSVEGLDYYVVEGVQAFKDLEDIVQQLDVSSEEKKATIDGLIAAKHYLKTDYKLHVRETSQTADHCCSYALHAQKNNCENHDHPDLCTKCHGINDTLQFVSQKAAERDWENPEPYLFKVDKAICDIKEWKCHILRSKNQARARSDAIEFLRENEVMVIADWAMKFLPRKFREGQTDWFAKRGINWHITYSVFKCGNVYKHLTHVHIFDCPVSQDSATTASVLVDTVTDIESVLPAIDKVTIFSDNAGCYKSTHTMAVLSQELGDKLKAYHFCEAQDGKGPCDRKSSHLKSAIKRHINEGNDVTDAHLMKMAIDSQQSGQYRVKVLSPVITPDVEKPQLHNIPAITTLHDFEFSKSGLKVWQAYGIGLGKFIPWSKVCTTTIPVAQFVVNDDWSNTAFSTVDAEVMSGERDDQSAEPPPKRQKQPQKVFFCPKEGCSRSFRFASSLDHHITLGNCDLTEEKHCLNDKAKILYAKKLDEGNLSKVPFCMSHSALEGKSNLDCGWALKVKRTKTNFTQDQKEFLNDKFSIGKFTGRKEDPLKVAEDMRFVLKDGKHRFSRQHYLTTQQIASYFSRLVQRDKKIDNNDVAAATLECKLESLKQEAMGKILL